MNVKTTFLNGYSEKEIYMQQLVRFIKKKGQENKVHKFLKSIYGLKQSS